MHTDRTGQTVLLTGAANGLGKSMVLDLLEQGFRVAAVDRDASGLERLRDETAGSAGQRLAVFTADLSDFDATQLVGRINASLGQIDILINNAGIGQSQIRADYHRHPPKFYQITTEQWSRAVAINASAVFQLSRAVIEPMLTRKWGRIVNITTSLGTMLRGGYAPYGPSKACAEALSSVMAADLEGSGVTVNVLIPGGVVNTSMIPPDAPFSRDQLLQPQAMLPPLRWLLSRAADGVSGRRFLAHHWDAALASEQAAAQAGAAVGWRDIAALPVTPNFVS